MKIKKVLNQNAVLVLDEGQEKVAVGKGVGFNKTKNDVLSRQLVERMFVMEPEGLKKTSSIAITNRRQILFSE